MRWESGRRSGNVEDRRAMSPRGVAMGGMGTVIMMILIYFLSGGDLGQVLQFFLANQGQAVQQQPGANRPPDPEEEEMAEFAKVILGDTEDVWTKIFAQAGGRYPPTPMVLYRGRVQSGCGTASSAAGPFYCPADQKVYLDLSFYEELDRRFGAPGDFARAYVIAHEVGHHVQNVLGTMKKRESLRGRMNENEFSVRLELQADFLAGVWAHHAQIDRQILEPGDIDEGLRAAAAIGDDALQKKAQGYVVPDSFTHGTSAQRARWFKKGFETGDINQGDTFSISEREL
ncbi:KPN_02809 family neutral zinc metallopeptidase [Planctomicrobium sp. SH661]|uniref:KPN_02809 family neutral zinc metallopeptidase n=1 Tax=Planctomicrobium sp. SH661 TaxID=3448124 RepID=UPI003F5C7BAA